MIQRWRRLHPKKESVMDLSIHLLVIADDEEYWFWDYKILEVS